MIVNMIITCVNVVITQCVMESSSSPWALESSDNASSVKLKEQVSIISLVAAHSLEPFTLNHSHSFEGRSMVT